MNATIDQQPFTPSPLLALLVQLPQGVGEIACAVVDEKMYVVTLQKYRVLLNFHVTCVTYYVTELAT